MNAVTELRKSIADGWNQIRERAQNAMTRYRGDAAAPKPTDDSDAFPASASWGLLFGEVFEDRDKVVVRLEAPGMDAGDFDIQVHGGTLVVRGEKRASREGGDGAYRLFECAYGRFERSIRLPAAVRSEKASATYRKGVLRIELPKAESAPPRQVKIKVR